MYYDAIAKLGVACEQAFGFPFLAIFPQTESLFTGYIIVGIIFISCFPSCQSRSVSSSENSGGGGHRTHSSTQVANSTMMADTNANSNSKSAETASDPLDEKTDLLKFAS